MNILLGLVLFFYIEAKTLFWSKEKKAQVWKEIATLAEIEKQF